MLLLVCRVLTNPCIVSIANRNRRQFLHRAADWSRSLEVIQLADILSCAYWCLSVK